MKFIQITRNIAIVLLFPMFINCTFQGQNQHKEELDSGKAIVDQLDHLFAKMANSKQNGTDLHESIVSTNEQIRQTIERNITNTQILNEIQAYLPKKKHAFSFVLSNDKKFGVFSWDTGKNDFPIKNIGLYVNNDKVVPTSLYGNPINYDRIYTIQNELGPPSYILGGFEDPSMTPHHYHLSAYLIRGGGIEETKAFPNGESTASLRCDESDLEKCLKTKNGSVLSESLYMAVAQQTLSIENGEYVFD